MGDNPNTNCIKIATLSWCTKKDDNVIVFFSFSAKNDAALPLISNNSFQTH